MSRVYVLLGRLADGTPLPTLLVPVHEFDLGNWFDAWVRFGARLEPGVTRSQLAAAVKARSGRWPVVRGGHG